MKLLVLVVTLNFINDLGALLRLGLQGSSNSIIKTLLLFLPFECMTLVIKVLSVLE